MQYVTLESVHAAERYSLTTPVKGNALNHMHTIYTLHLLPYIHRGCHETINLYLSVYKLDHPCLTSERQIYLFVMVTCYG
jgi:hypothetical protein